MRSMFIFHRTGFGLSPPNNPVPRLSPKQNLMVGTLWTTYALFYLGRVNISVVLPSLALALNVSRAEVGVLGTVFFWVYGIGHFVSGEIGSHLSPFRLVSAGLLGIALVNLAFAFQTSLLVMLALWGINGIAQSTGWAPMFRILAEGLDRSQIKRVSTVMPFSYVVGTALTWTLIGAVAAGAGWQAAFWLPGLLTLGVLGFWWKMGMDAPKAKSAGFSLRHIAGEVRSLGFVLVATALVGFVFNGTIIWLPSYILDSALIPPPLVGMVAALMQVIAISGLFLARYWVVRSNQVFVTAVILFVAAAGALLLLSLTAGVLALLLVVLALIMLNGGFGLVVSSMPLLLAAPGRAASTTGSVNMMSNFFGGVAGFTVGGLVEISGWQAVFGLWGMALLLAAALLWQRRGDENRPLGALRAAAK